MIPCPPARKAGPCARKCRSRETACPTRTCALRRDDWDDLLAKRFVAKQPREQSNEGHRGADGRAAFEKLRIEIPLRHIQRWRVDNARGQEAAQFLAAFHQILVLLAVRLGTVEGRLDHFFVADGYPETRAEF